MNLSLNIKPELLKVYAYFNGGSHFNTSQLRCKIVNATSDEGYDCKGYEVWFYGQSEDEAWYVKNTGHSSGDYPFDTIYLKDLVIDGTEEVVITKLIKDSLKGKLQQHITMLLHMQQLFADAGI